MTKIWRKAVERMGGRHQYVTLERSTYHFWRRSINLMCTVPRFQSKVIFRVLFLSSFFCLAFFVFGFLPLGASYCLFVCFCFCSCSCFFSSILSVLFSLAFVFEERQCCLRMKRGVPIGGMWSSSGGKKGGSWTVSCSVVVGITPGYDLTGEVTIWTECYIFFSVSPCFGCVLCWVGLIWLVWCGCLLSSAPFPARRITLCFGASNGRASSTNLEWGGD